MTLVLNTKRFLPMPAMATAAIAIILLIIVTLLSIFVSTQPLSEHCTLASLTTPILLFQSVHTILSASQRSTVPKRRRKGTPTHVLIVLGSGGHTAEMLSMLRRMPLNTDVYTFRTYIVTSGDSFSASKALEFEQTLEAQYGNGKDKGASRRASSYEVVTVPRARRVHQSYLTAPLSTIQCFWACLQVLRGRHPDQARKNKPENVPTYPDLILTNGPATAVCVVFGAKLLRLSNALYALLIKNKSTTGDNPATASVLRTIFIESWARVTTLSLSGKILLPFVDRFLVQWPDLEGKRAWRGMRGAEFVGTIIE